MSAERLREAAKVLRERAEAATPGLWYQDHEADGELLDDGTGWQDDESVPTATVLSAAPYDEDDFLPGYPYDVAEAGNVPNAAYIATMHPGVGLALADTMELEASLLEGLPALAGLLNVTMEHESGIKGYIKFAQKPDGQPHMHAESTSGLLRIADLILGGERQ